MKYYIILLLNLFFFHQESSAQGPYAPHVGQQGTSAIHRDSAVFVNWASNAIIERGWQNIADTSLGKTTAGTVNDVLGKSGTGGVVSLGDGGSAILTFATPIKNEPGADFAVFENSFNDSFLELAFVEVSSDGVNFFRFPSHSLTQNSVQLDNNANMDATNINNLAGKYRAQYGTPFDLEELTGISGLDVNNITHVKIIDVVGNIDPEFARYDNFSNIINDPFPTPFPTGGFDLDAVGVIHQQTVSIEENNTLVQQVYPNPFQNYLTIQLKNNESATYEVVSSNGQQVLSGQLMTGSTISTENLPKGIYFLKVQNQVQQSVQKLIKY